MESRNLDRALDIVSKLINGENVGENGDNAALYQEYSTNAQVYDIVMMTLKKMNLDIYEYKNSLYVSAGQNNPVFGYTNEELRKELGVKLNRELYLAYFVIYNTITSFYSDTSAANYTSYVRIEDVGKYYVQIFDSTLANWMGEQPGICTMAKTCGHAGVMEFNGDVYSCDHFVFPEYKLGNIYSKTLVEMMHSERQHNFGNMKYQSLPTQCKECEFLFACNGECPKNRFSQTAEGEPGLNYLCKGYYQFFKHVAPYMDFMKNELMNQRPPANIMEALRNGELRVES